MAEFQPIRSWPKTAPFKSGDTLVVFGEVFERGYVNGVIDEAKKHGLNVIYSTVGRRDAEQKLRPLTAEELDQKKQHPLINIPLEAGFDLEAGDDGIRLIDQLKEYGLTGWEDAKLNWKSIEEAKQRGEVRFRSYTQKFLAEVEKQIDPKKNLIFVHTMAGGFPRAKVVMPIANRVFKGQGARYQSSRTFWESEIGRLCDQSFNEVTAQTLHHLIDLSAPLRNKIEKAGSKVCYMAFGYHGNEILTENEYRWFSYSPYLQGFAKVALEEICKKAQAGGIRATTYNVPEILTNSSSIFLGIEVVIYPLVRALKKEGGAHPAVAKIIHDCEALLKEPFTFADIDKLTQEYLMHPKVRAYPKFQGWPQHNDPEQMELMLNTSAKIIEMHKDSKKLLTAELSELVFRACGLIQFNTCLDSKAPALWIGHDAVAKAVLN